MNGQLTANARSWLAQLRQALTGPRSISLLGCLILLPLSLVSTVFTESYRFPNLFGPLVITVAITAVDAVLLLIADRTLLRNRHVKPVPLSATLLTYTMVAVARPITAYLLSPLLKPTADIVSSRILGSVVVAGLVLGLVALVLDGADRRRETLSRLQQESDHLEQLRRSYAEQIRAEQELLDQTVRVQVAPILSSIQEHLQNSAPTATPDEVHHIAAELRYASSEVVRPLSHSLSQNPAQRDRIRVERFRQTSSGSARWRTLVRDTFLVKPFHPILAPVLLFVLSLSETTKLAGWTMGIVAPGGYSILLGLALWASSKILHRQRLAQFSPAMRVSVVLSAYVISATAANLVTQPVWRLTSIPETYYFVALPWVLVFCIAPAANSAVEVGRQRALIAVQAIVAAQQWEVEYLQREVEVLSNRAGRKLHGGVQSQLSVLALTLDAVAGNENCDQHLLHETMTNALTVLQSLRLDIEALYQPVQERLLLEALEELRDVWDGVVDVGLDLSADATELVEQHGLSSALVELSREAIQNSSKHGSASRILIRMYTEEFALVFEALDNGVGPSDRSDPGLGLSQVTADGYEWELTPGPDGGALLLVRVPAFHPVVID